MKRSYRCADLVELERDSIKIQKICDYMDDLKFLKNSTIMSDEELVDLDDDVAIEEGDDILNVYGDTSSEDLSDDLENDAELCPILEEGKSFGPRRILRCSRRTSTRPSSDDLFTSFDDFRSLLSDCSEKKNKLLDNNNILTNCY